MTIYIYIYIYIAASSRAWQFAGRRVEVMGALYVRSIEGACGVKERAPLHLDVAGRMCDCLQTEGFSLRTQLATAASNDSPPQGHVVQACCTAIGLSGGLVLHSWQRNHMGPHLRVTGRFGCHSH